MSGCTNRSCRIICDRCLETEFRTAPDDLHHRAFAAPASIAKGEFSARALEQGLGDEETEAEPAAARFELPCRVDI